MRSAESWFEQPFDDWNAADFDAGNPADDSPFDNPFDSLEDVDSPAGLDDEFELDAASGLYLPQPGLVSGPAALALAGTLNPFVADSLDGDDLDEFFKKMWRGIKRVGSVVGRVAGPLIKRALPMIQKVVGFAGPWGRLISAGIGAVQGIASGKGLRGALAGALSGAIPGIGGKLASAVLSADGADDDAALDLLADMADAGQAHPAVAFPVGAGLASRIAARSGGAVPGGARPAERWMARLSVALRGSPGYRLRVMRSIGRLAGALLARNPQAAMIRGAMLAAIRQATTQVLAQLRRDGSRWLRSTTPRLARARLGARRAVLGGMPSNQWGFPMMAAA